MHRVLIGFVLCLISEGSAQEPAPPRDSPDDGLDIALKLEQTFARIAEETFPSLVTVTSYERDPEVSAQSHRESSWVVERLSNDYPGYRKLSIASGIVVTREGHVLTCRHPLLKKDGKLADLVSVETQDQRHTISVVLGAEPTLNLAVLKMEVFAEQFPPAFRPAKLGNSGAIRPGHWAIGCGDPEGPEMFYSVGTFTSQPSRDCYQEQLTATYMQAAMKVHPQAYGGPLLNVRGEVVGMLCPRFENPATLAIAEHQGLEFALPSNIVQGLYQAIVAKGSFRSPWIGIAVMSRPELIRERGIEAFHAMNKPRHGIYIENVFQPSPAHTLGIRPGDFLVQLGVNPIHTPLDFQKYLYLAGIGSTVELEMFRDGQTSTVDVKIEARPEQATTR